MRQTVPGATQGVGSGHKNRRVRIAMDPAAVDMASLPFGVQLKAGHLEISFYGAYDLADPALQPGAGLGRRLPHLPKAT